MLTRNQNSGEYFLVLKNVIENLFRCLGSVTDCSYDTVTKNIETATQPRQKRSVDEVCMIRKGCSVIISFQEAWLLEQAREDDYRLTDEICQTDAEECNRRLAVFADAYDDQQTNSRRRRSADEDTLLEMALLTEGSYEASISSVSDTSVTFSFPQLPAGKYDIIVNRSVGINIDIN